MSWETVIEGKLYTALGEQVVRKGSVWIHQTFIEGEHKHMGPIVIGLAGKTETIKQLLLPQSFVDPSIRVNGESNASSYNHLVVDEHRHLLEPHQPTPAFELVEGIGEVISTKAA